MPPTFPPSMPSLENPVTLDRADQIDISVLVRERSLVSSGTGYGIKTMAETAPLTECRILVHLNQCDVLTDKHSIIYTHTRPSTARNDVVLRTSGCIYLSTALESSDRGAESSVEEMESIEGSSSDEVIDSAKESKSGKDTDMGFGTQSVFNTHATVRLIKISKSNRITTGRVNEMSNTPTKTANFKPIAQERRKILEHAPSASIGGKKAAIIMFIGTSGMDMGSRTKNH
ncbi:hypothetical protein BGW38_006262, partial [Lunasporangiospora selenospora]